MLARLRLPLVLLALVLAACLVGRTTGTAAQAATIAGPRLTAMVPVTVGGAGFSWALQPLGFDANNDIEIDTGFAFAGTTSQGPYTSTNRPTIYVYDCSAGGTVIPLSGCALLAEWDGDGQNITASTITTIPWESGYGAPYTLTAGHVLTLLVARLGSFISPCLQVLGT